MKIPAAGLALALLALLVQAVAASAASNVVRYTYDAAGNIVAIVRDGSAGMSISGFTPASGPPGTVVTISGSGFAASANAVRFNGVPAAVASASPAAITAVVPAGATTGRIEVTAGGATATSPQDFVVAALLPPPIPGIAGGDVLATSMLAADGPAQRLPLLAANKFGLLLFDGRAGDWLSAQVANFAVNPTGASIAYTIYKPDLTRLAGGTLTASNLSIHVPQLGAAGRYVLLVATGAAQVSLDVMLETNRIVPADGTSLAVSRRTGQTTRALIPATAGDQKALVVSALSTGPSGVNLDWTIGLPNGSVFQRLSVSPPGLTTLLPPFMATGTHTLLAAPASTGSPSSFGLALTGGAPLAVDGPPADIVIAGQGEGARLTFVGTGGDNLGLGVTRLALSPSTLTSTSFTVYRPEATPLANGTCRVDGTQCSANLASLPVSGIYSVIVQPAGGATGSMQAWLSRDVAGVLTSGQPLALALSRPGQNARLAFSATAGSVVALQVRGVTTSPAGQGLLVQILGPDGRVLESTHLTGSGATIVAQPLPATGTYSVFIEPESAAQGAATASMDVLVDPGQSLVVDGPTRSASIGIAGAAARFNFAASAGQSLGLGASAMAFAKAADATITVYKPDASALTAITCSGSVGRCGANLGSLPAGGTYAIVVRPAAGATGSLDLTLSSDLARTLLPGSPLALVLDRPGANARLSFVGTAGQALRLSWAGVSIPGTASPAVATMLAPNGSTLGSAQLFSGIAGSFDLPALPASGTYAIFVDPPVGATMSATLTLAQR